VRIKLHYLVSIPRGLFLAILLGVMSINSRWMICVLTLLNFVSTLRISLLLPPYTADGRPGYDVHCNGAALTWAACSAKAGELCEARGYDILERHMWGFPLMRNMIVACKQ
jgi:hypothetical protein